METINTLGRSRGAFYDRPLKLSFIVREGNRQADRTRDRRSLLTRVTNNHYSPPSKSVLRDNADDESGQSLARNVGGI